MGRAVESEDSSVSLSQGLSSAGGSTYDAFQYGVYRTFIGFTGTFTGLMVAVEVVVRGPLAAQTLAFITLLVILGTLWFRTRYTRDTKAGTILSMSAFMVALAGFEFFQGDIAPVGVRVAVVASPIITVLLAGARPALFFFFWGIVHTTAYTPTNGNFGLHLLQAVGSVLVGGVLLAMAWRFDWARRRAERLAHERELALRDALTEARAAVSARTNFLSNMSHEIRTPMNGVLGLSRLLVEETDPARRELANTVVSSAESLLRILDDILDLSKLDAGALLIEKRTERPAEIAQQVVALMRYSAEERGLKLRLSLDPKLPEWVRLDGHRFRQVLSNLVGNAVKFTRAGSIDVNLDYIRGDIVCEVVDTGIGINESVLKTLFTPFQQADESTARKFGGTGLGLAICRRLCEFMGGHISASSVVGKGSVFRFSLPGPEVIAPSAAASDDIGPLPSSLSVLVAEDNRVNRLVARRMLEKLGVNVTFVEDGDEAVHAVAATTFDLVLMDRHMPNVDGLEATRRIRKLPTVRSGTPIVALTASVMADDRTECIEAGMNAFIPKPIEPKLLEQTLRRHARCPS